MSAIRASLFAPASVLRPVVGATSRSAAYTQHRLAHQDYGSGQGDPAGEKPNEQSTSEKAREAEHPGPEPPKVGQENSKKQSGQSQKSAGGGESSQGKSKGKGASAAEPKILVDKMPETLSDSAVQHNKEMENRADRANMKPENDGTEGGEKVEKGYWTGESGDGGSSSSF